MLYKHIIQKQFDFYGMFSKLYSVISTLILSFEFKIDFLQNLN